MRIVMQQHFLRNLYLDFLVMSVNWKHKILIKHFHVSLLSLLSVYETFANPITPVAFSVYTTW